MHRLALAFQFLTILPWPRLEVRRPEDLGGSVAFYPVVGAALGSFMVGVHLMGSEVFPDGVLRPALVVLLIILTGGLHLDGLADVCDGFYAGRTKADALRIMKDPHHGTMAVVGIISVLMMKVVLLSSLPAAVLCSALLIFPVIGRGGMVWGMWMAPYARPEGGTGEMFFRTLCGHHVWIATVLLGVWVMLFAGWPGVVLLLLAAGATQLFVGYCGRRIGGMTGDTLGALDELLELLTLALYYPLSRWHMSPGPLVSPRFFW
ncbi:MAG: adenosylcobinamide-GDP ribazoletransferase [Candidatus Entotheonellia bacterium]